MHLLVSQHFSCSQTLSPPKMAAKTSGALRPYCLLLVSLISGCTCVTAGTIQPACSDQQCNCDSQTGACLCRANIAGHNCDQCAPNHWNYGQQGGCEACGCDPQHAMGTHCNMVRKHRGW